MEILFSLDEEEKRLANPNSDGKHRKMRGECTAQ